MKTAKIGMVLIVGLVATPVLASLVNEKAPEQQALESQVPEASGFDFFGITDRALRTRVVERELQASQQADSRRSAFGSDGGLVSGFVDRAHRTRVVERDHL